MPKKIDQRGFTCNLARQYDKMFRIAHGGPTETVITLLLQSNSEWTHMISSYKAGNNYIDTQLVQPCHWYAAFI
jgi:hypothetical protein